MPVSCSIRSCTNCSTRNKDVSYFYLPRDSRLCVYACKDELMKRKFNRKIRMEVSDHSDDAAEGFRICIHHFDESCLKKRCPRPLLHRKAIPTHVKITDHEGDKRQKQSLKRKVGDAESEDQDSVATSSSKMNGREEISKVEITLRNG